MIDRSRDPQDARRAANPIGELTGRKIDDGTAPHVTTPDHEAAMIETRRVETGPGLVFDVSVSGPGSGPLADHAQYRIDRLIGDAFDIVSVLGFGDRRFHLVGHDWGASLAWQIADEHPERLLSLTSLSRPHPLAFARALALPDGEQARRSRHHTRFLQPNAGPDILAGNANWLRTRLTANGVPPAAIEAHLSVLGNPPAMEAALAWYRARGVRHAPVGPTKVPTLFLWGDSDDTVGRAAAEGTGEFIAAPYQFEVLPGVGHYAADQVPERVNELLLAHLARHGV
jgi:pimeloyl-ACP methyl ester carboxylesterase